ncbi:MAG: hypothetical protein Q4G51_08355, partial [Dermatophilus congolensis]|nr:hypothetical protein [Dermatophilus congolensis]
MSSAAGQVFDVLVEAAAEEFTQLAPFSPRFVIGAHREVLHRTDAILTRLDAMSDKLTDIHAGVEELRARSLPAQGAIELGDIPGRPATNIDRDELNTLRYELNTLRATLAVRGRAAVCAGGRGVGKSQLAAAYARERIDERCPLVVWINAETEESILAALAGLAAEVGRADPEGDQRRSAENALRYLNAYTEAGLVVFDNATDREATSPRLPTTGGCQVVITSTDHAFAQLAVEVPVGEFTDTQATDYLRERTTLTEADCELVADELGNLPLALAAAASVISAKRWTAARYLEELAKADLDKALPRTADYPRTLAAAITLTIETVETDSDAALVLVLLSMLDVAGVSRDLLTRIATTLKPDTDVDEALAALTRASVASWAATGDDVLMHRLVARVARDRAASRGNATRNLATTLRCLQQSIPDDHRHQPDTPEFARHILHGLELALDAVETAGAERDAIAATGHALCEYGYSSGATAEAISASERLRELNERLL